MIKNFICPNPMRWNEIYINLCKGYEEKTNLKLPKTVSEIYLDGGPPTPLILNGWVFSDDIDKKNRWSETLKWAEKNNLLNLTYVDEADRYYFT